MAAVVPVWLVVPVPDKAPRRLVENSTNMGN